MAENAKAWASFKKNQHKYPTYKAYEKALKNAKPSERDLFILSNTNKQRTQQIYANSQAGIDLARDKYANGEIDSQRLAVSVGRELGEAMAARGDSLDIGRNIVGKMWSKAAGWSETHASKKEIKEKMTDKVFDFLTNNLLIELNLREEGNAKELMRGLESGLATYNSGGRQVGSNGKSVINRLLTRVVDELVIISKDPYADKSDEELAAMGLIRIKGYAKAADYEVKAHYRKIK